MLGWRTCERSWCQCILMSWITSQRTSVEELGPGSKKFLRAVHAELPRHSTRRFFPQTNISMCPNQTCPELDVETSSSPCFMRALSDSCLPFFFFLDVVDIPGALPLRSQDPNTIRTFSQVMSPTTTEDEPITLKKKACRLVCRRPSVMVERGDPLSVHLIHQFGMFKKHRDTAQKVSKLGFFWNDKESRFSLTVQQRFENTNSKPITTEELIKC